MNNLAAIEFAKQLIAKTAKPSCLVDEQKLVFANTAFFRMTGFSENSNTIIRDIFQDKVKFQFFAYDTICLINTAKETKVKTVVSAVQLPDNDKYFILNFTEFKAGLDCTSIETDFYYYFENNPMGIICVNKKLEIDRYNETAQKLFNLSGNKILLASIVPEQNMEHFTETIDRCSQLKCEEVITLNTFISENEPVICKWHIKYCNENKILIFIYNITKEKLAEYKSSKERAKLESANLKLKQNLKETRKMTTEVSYANNAKSEFIANISHELRTPLNAIMGFSEILAKDITDEKQINYLKSIIQSARSLLDIINGILDYSKLEAGKMKVKTDEININTLLENICDVFQGITQQKGLRFILDIDENLPNYLELDRHLFSQIVRNLLDNAVKFTKHGSITLKVTFDEIEDDYIDLNIKVIDTGIGIPKNQQKKIFYAFSQKDGQTHADYGGTGLGLSIVKKTVTLLSGSLSMKSKSGEGTTFEIILPNISKTNKKEVKENALINNIDIARIDFNNGNAIVLDKTKFTRLLVNNLLADYSINLIESSTIQESLNIISDKKIELIMINESIIISNALEKKFDQLMGILIQKSIPIIIYGNQFYEDITQKWRNINFQWVVKPINKDDLVKAIAKLINFKKIITDNKKVQAKEIISKSIPKERIERLLNFLNVEIVPKCNYFYENLIINKIEELCEEITIIGEKNQLLNIIEWSKKLRMALDNFDIMNIRQLLEGFPKIVEEIGLLLNRNGIN